MKLHVSLLAAALLAQTAPATAQDLEKIPTGEAKAIEEIRARALVELKKRYPEAGQSLVRRDAHAKAHGCVKATFEVDPNIPPDLRVGTFSSPTQRFRVLIRFSNGAFVPGDDTGKDGRGMAVKIIDADPAGASASRQRPPHDVLMINHPAFFSRNVADYKVFSEYGALTGDTLGLIGYFGLGFRFRGGAVALEIATKEIKSPLTAQYYSMAPFLYSEGRAVKYSAKPCAGQTRAGQAPPPGPNFLKEALWSHLASAPACFDFMVQERKGNMAVEDVVPTWSESAAPFRRVGRIDIPAGQTSTPERDQTCESLTFNPWNAPSEQRPLGGINRLRKVVYEAISAYRNSRNKVTPGAPADIWAKF